MRMVPSRLIQCMTLLVVLSLGFVSAPVPTGAILAGVAQSGGAEGDGTDGVTIDVANFAFTPVAATAQVGETVTWNWVSGFHSVETQDGAQEWCPSQGSGTCDKVFDAPGTFAYRCGVHPTSMQATLTIEGSAAAAITIASPSAGETVSGEVIVSGTASAAGGISSVTVAIDGDSGQSAELVGEDWSFTFDSSAYSDESHTVVATAAPNQEDNVSASVDVVFSNPVLVAIAAPADGATVSDLVQIEGTASHGQGISAVQWRIDGAAWSPAQGTEDWSFSWQSGSAANGVHTIEVEAFSGARSARASVDVSVQNLVDVAILAPLAGATVGGNVDVSGTADHINGIDWVEVRIAEAGPVVASGTQSWTATLNVGNEPNGPATVSATAFSLDGVQATMTIEIQIDNPISVAIETPTDGATVAGVLTVSGQAAHSSGIELIERSIAGATFEEVPHSAGAWTFDYDTLAQPNGPLAIVVRATSTTGVVGESSISVHVNNPFFADLVALGLTTQDGGLQPARLHAHVSNSGNIPATDAVARFEYEYQGEWRVIGESSVTLAPDETQTVSIDWLVGLRVGEFPVRVRLDPDNVFEEPNEADNAAADEVSVWTNAVEGFDAGQPFG